MREEPGQSARTRQLMDQGFHAVEDEHELSAVGAGCRRGTHMGPGTHCHPCGPACDRMAVAGCTCCLPWRLQTRLQPGGRILCTAQHSASAPAVRNAQGPACHSGFNYRKQGTLSTACFTRTRSHLLKPILLSMARSDRCPGNPLRPQMEPFCSPQRPVLTGKLFLSLCASLQEKWQFSTMQSGLYCPLLFPDRLELWPP